MAREVVDLSKASLKASDKAACKAELRNARWSKGYACRSCGNTKAYFLKERNSFECANKKCKLQTSPTAGTQFHNSRTLEKQWPLLRDRQQGLKTPAKTLIRKAINVSAQTASKVASIIAASFSRDSEKKIVQDSQAQVVLNSKATAIDLKHSAKEERPEEAQLMQIEETLKLILAFLIKSKPFYSSMKATEPSKYKAAVQNERRAKLKNRSATDKYRRLLGCFVESFQVERGLREMFRSSQRAPA